MSRCPQIVPLPRLPAQMCLYRSASSTHGTSAVHPDHSSAHGASTAPPWVHPTSPQPPHVTEHLEVVERLLPVEETGNDLAGPEGPNIPPHTRVLPMAWHAGEQANTNCSNDSQRALERGSRKMSAGLVAREGAHSPLILKSIGPWWGGYGLGYTAAPEMSPQVGETSGVAPSPHSRTQHRAPSALHTSTVPQDHTSFYGTS